MESILSSLALPKSLQNINRLSNEDKVKNIIETLFNEFELNTTIKIGNMRLFYIKDDENNFEFDINSDCFFKTSSYITYIYNVNTETKDYFRFQYSDNENIKYFYPTVNLNHETDLALIENYEKYLLNKQLNEELPVNQNTETKKVNKI